MKPAVFEHTDPDGIKIDVRVNKSFGPTVTVFIEDTEDDESCGFRMTPAEWRKMVETVGNKLSELGW